MKQGSLRNDPNSYTRTENILPNMADISCETLISPCRPSSIYLFSFSLPPANISFRFICKGGSNVWIIRSWFRLCCINLRRDAAARVVLIPASTQGINVTCKVLSPFLVPPILLIGVWVSYGKWEMRQQTIADTDTLISLRHWWKEKKEDKNTSMDKTQTQ